MPPATVPASSAVRHDGGGKSPVGGTTPTVVAKQPVHGEGAPASIIRAILERNLSGPLGYSVDEALSGHHHVTPPAPSPTDDHETSTRVNGYYASDQRSTSTPQPASTVTQTSDEVRRATVDSVVGRPASVDGGVSTQPQSNCSSARSDRLSLLTRKRTGPSTHHPLTHPHPVAAKHRRFTTDGPAAAEQPCARNTNGKRDAASRYSAAADSGSQPTVDTGAFGAYGQSAGSTASQQNGNNVNGISSVADENQNRQNGDACSTSEAVQVERTTSTTRVALPKKVYAYLGSAGAARENAAAHAAAAMGDRDHPCPSTCSTVVTPSVVGNNSPASGTATAGRRSASDDGPIRHLRLMCSGLAASTGGLELSSHSTA